jgi:hypothetical protein
MSRDFGPTDTFIRSNSIYQLLFCIQELSATYRGDLRFEIVKRHLERSATAE